MADSSTKRHSSIISPMVKRSSFALLVLALACLAAAAQESDDRLTSETFGGLRFRSIGPAVTSGRVVDIAVHPDNRKIHYVAAASGGVWKTENSGTTWTPIFDDQPSYSIGCVRMDPNNPLVVWVGTGENNSQRRVSYGDGVYKSVDGGKSWKNMGLQSSEHIAKILVDPRDSDTVYVASQGPLWRAGGERGLYKTADGGETWTLVLEISENTGVTDFVMDPRDPDVLVAASYQRRRHVWTLIDGGPESALYKTTDGGENWEKLTRGLPKGDVGRIGLAQSPANPDVVYAIIEAEADASGVYRSIDAGSNWEKRNPHVSGSPQYYQELVADPKNSDRVYSMDTYMMVSEDGARLSCVRAKRSSMWTTTRSGSTPRTRITSSSVATAASTKASIGARAGTSRRTSPSLSSIVSASTTISLFTTSTEAPRTTSASVDPRERCPRTASSTPTGS